MDKKEQLEVAIDALKECGEEHPNDKGIKRALVVLERSLKDEKGENRYATTEAEAVPGAIMYIPAEAYIGHGQDDIAGGKVTIKEVKEWSGKSPTGAERNLVVVFEEFPGHTYNLSYLLKEQPELRKRYGHHWARPDPDFGYYGDE